MTLGAVQARLPEIDQLTEQLRASSEELSNVKFQLEEDKATASAAQVSVDVNDGSQSLAQVPLMWGSSHVTQHCKDTIRSCLSSHICTPDCLLRPAFPSVFALAKSA